jgi:hypothetical protein
MEGVMHFDVLGNEMAAGVSWRAGDCIGSFALWKREDLRV